jgi:hypothetical protein
MPAVRPRLGVLLVRLTYATYVASRVPSERRPPMVDQVEFGYRVTFTGVGDLCRRAGRSS